MRPLIGVSTNCTVDPAQIINKGLVLADQRMQYIADDYIKAIERAGGTPVILPIMNNIDSLMPILSILDGMIFTGGSDIDPCYYHDQPSQHLGIVNPI